MKDRFHINMITMTNVTAEIIFSILWSCLIFLDEFMSHLVHRNIYYCQIFCQFIHLETFGPLTDLIVLKSGFSHFDRSTLSYVSIHRIRKTIGS